jgi:hypothetical protein
MTTSPPSTHDSASSVTPELVAHRVLREQVRRLRAHLLRSPPDNQRLAWLAVLCLELVDLTDVLASHFEAEETDDALAEALERRPDLVRRVRRLAEQHRGMLRALDGVRMTLGELPLQHVAARILSLLERLEEHEREETELLQVLYLEDEGQGH